MVEYRIEYSKTGGARWLSHLELIRTFIRALRRSGLPLVFSRGFNPHPRLSYCPSLGVGVAGLREYLDLDLAAAMPLSEGMASLGRQLPPGLEIGRLMELPPEAPGIGKAVNCAWYRLVLPPEQTDDAWQQAIDRLVCGSDPLYYKRPKDGKLFDVRSGLAACRFQMSDVRCQTSDKRLIGPSEQMPEAGEKKDVQRPATPVFDLLMDLGEAAAPLRGIVETLFSLAAGGNEGSGAGTKDLSTEQEGIQAFNLTSDVRRPTSVFQPARVTRMALLHQNGGLVNPLGERKRLWET